MNEKEDSDVNLICRKVNESLFPFYLEQVEVCVLINSHIKPYKFFIKKPQGLSIYRYRLIYQSVCNIIEVCCDKYGLQYIWNNCEVLWR